MTRETEAASPMFKLIDWVLGLLTAIAGTAESVRIAAQCSMHSTRRLLCSDSSNWMYPFKFLIKFSSLLVLLKYIGFCGSVCLAVQH